MRRTLKIAIFAILFTITLFWSYVLYTYLTPPPRIDMWGKTPEFSVNLVDNGENDYMDLKYIKLGTGIYGRDYVILGTMMAKVRPMENIENYFLKDLPAVVLSLGENIRVFFSADVVKRGKLYQVQIIDTGFGIEFGIDNVRCE